MTRDDEGFDPRAAEVYEELFGAGFSPPFRRARISTEAAIPRRQAQRGLIGNDVVDVQTRAVAIFSVLIADGHMAQGKLYMQGLRNVGFSDRQVAELIETIGLFAGIPRAVAAHVLLDELIEEDEARSRAPGFYYVPPGG
jgi:alkylhydroperoxidase/carboxymuconolactone decarboxylase family protein YurZ